MLHHWEHVLLGMLLDGDLGKDEKVVGDDDLQEEDIPWWGDAAGQGTESSRGRCPCCSTAGGVGQAPAGDDEADSHLCNEVVQEWWCLLEVCRRGGALAGEAGCVHRGLGNEGSGWRGLSRSDLGQGWSDVTSGRELRE